MPDAQTAPQSTRSTRCARPPRRLARLALLLVYMAVGFVALAADARAEEGPGVSHFETAADRCAGGHDHASCQFCRLIGSSLDRAARSDAPEELAAPLLPPRPTDDHPAKAPCGPFAGSRAPPLD